MNNFIIRDKAVKKQALLSKNTTSHLREARSLNANKTKIPTKKGGSQPISSQNNPLHRFSMAECFQCWSKCFVAHGYHGTSISRLANAVGMGKASVYHYCDSKEQLLTQIINHINQDFRVLVGEPLPNPSHITINLPTNVWCEKLSEGLQQLCQRYPGLLLPFYLGTELTIQTPDHPQALVDAYHLYWRYWQRLIWSVINTLDLPELERLQLMDDWYHKLIAIVTLKRFFNELNPQLAVFKWFHAFKSWVRYFNKSSISIKGENS